MRRTVLFVVVMLALTAGVASAQSFLIGTNFGIDEGLRGADIGTSEELRGAGFGF